MTTYTREHLEQKISMKVWECDLAAFTLALLDENEALRRDKIQLGEERAAEWKRAEKAEAERDEANDERDDAVARWSRRAREAEAACKELLQVQIEQDRLREELREAEEAIRLIERITVTYDDARSDGDSERVARVSRDFLDHAAVRRARERAK